MNQLPLCLLLLAFNLPSLAATTGVDARTAILMDSEGAQSSVSALSVSNIGERFGFDRSDDTGRIVLVTKNLELAIPLRAITAIKPIGSTSWTVIYATSAGEVTAIGELSPELVLTGNSEFGTFTLPLAKLSRLEFSQPGTPTGPAKRLPALGADGTPRQPNFAAVLTLTDGTRLPVTLLRRHTVHLDPDADPDVLSAVPTIQIGFKYYADFRFVRGATAQIMPFELIKAVDFLPGDTVYVTTLNGTRAEMQMSRQNEEVLSGFSGYSSKGDFYIQYRYVKTITFGEAPK